MLRISSEAAPRREAVARSAASPRNVSVRRLQRTVPWTAAALALSAVFPCAISRADETRGPSLRIWPTAVVSGEQVILGDVAEWSGFDDETTVRMSSVAVRLSPMSGGETLVGVDDIRRALKDAGLNIGAARIFGSSRCRVTRMSPPREARATVRPRVASEPSPANAPREARSLPIHRPAGPRSISEMRQAALDGSDDSSHSGAMAAGDSSTPVGDDTLEAALHRHIAAGFSRDEGRVDIRFSPTSRKLLATIVGPHERVVIRERDRKRIGLVSFDVSLVTSVEASELQRKGSAESGSVVLAATRTGEKREMLISAEIALLRDVVVARRPINQGQLIAARDLKLEERRFERSEEIGMVDIAAAAGQVCKRFIREGEMIDARSIETRPVVRRGDVVQIVAGGGGVEIRTSGQAQTSGALGDVITVRRDGSRRKQDLIDATVAGPGLVTYSSSRQIAARGE